MDIGWIRFSLANDKVEGYILAFFSFQVLSFTLAADPFLVWQAAGNKPLKAVFARSLILIGILTADAGGGTGPASLILSRI
ncbi:hypothetical protein ACFQNF_11795 [Iodobacter arcticus]|uniref:Uncharacterized protein n=1 Tax=Iodobacter arcticus TaxID=590593 RepID=A0ABW2R057_9NEIS